MECIKNRASISRGSRAPRIQLATKCARKSAPVYGAEGYSTEEDDCVQEDEMSPDLSPTEEEQRQLLYTNLLNALWSPSAETEPARGTFAACQAVKYLEGFILKSFHFEGVGELRLPLSTEDTSKLRDVCEQAPFGKGWQMDASKLTFPGAPEFLVNIQPLAMRAMCALGLDGAAVQLEAQPYKLLLHETGDHFTFHRDTEEESIFATLLLQLPTEEGYTGGKLVVKHCNSKKKFDCHLVSALGFCYTVFYADCMHEMRKIESGTRLCLAFNLVKRNSSLDLPHREFISSKVRKADVALQPWLEEATERKLDIFGGKLGIPLQKKICPMLG